MPTTTLNKLYKRTTKKVRHKGVLGKLSPSVLEKRLGEIIFNWYFIFPIQNGASFTAIKDIHLDLERFQNRMEEYSEESVRKIVANYDFNRFDPVMLWKDPKNGKTYLLSGHSRLEAMKRRKEKNIPCRFFEGSESEAILYAKSFSNRAGTAEGLLSDIKAFKLERDGTDKVQKLTQVRLKDNWGSRYNKLNSFTFLNPKGKFLEYLSTEGKNSFPYIENRGYNVGLWRKNFPQISNTQENEIFDYWYGKGANLTLEEMTNKISRAVMRLDFDPETPLHLEKGATGLEARADTAEAQKRLFEIEDELKAIKFKVREAFTQAEKEALRKEVESLLAEKERIERNVKIVTKTQQSLFGLKVLKFSRKTPQNLKKGVGVVFKKISYQTAYEAYRGISHSPERRATSTIKEELMYLRAVYFKYADFARKSDRIAEYDRDFNEFQGKYVEKVTTWLNSLSRVLSSMITGPSNFPVKRNEKRLSTEHKRMLEVIAFAEKGETYFDAKYNPRSRQNTAIKTGSSDALLRLEQKLADAEKSQMLAKIINKTIKVGLKKGLTAKEMAEIVTNESGIEVAEKFMQEFLSPDFAGRTGVPAYKLTNNNAEINRLKARIQTEKHYHQKAAEGGNEYKFDAGKVVENYEDNRIEIYFTTIPLQEIRTEMKKRAFKWTPTKGAWQKQLISTGNPAKYAVAEVEGIVGKLELIPKEVPKDEVEAVEVVLTPSNLENIMNEIEQDLEATLTKKRANKFSRKTPVHLKKGKGLAQIVDNWKHAFRQVIDVQVPVDISVLIGYYQNHNFKDLYSCSSRSFRYVWTHAQIAKFMYANSLYNEKDAGKLDRLERLKAIVSDDVYMEWLDSEFIRRGLDYQFELYLNTTGSKIIPD